MRLTLPLLLFSLAAYSQPDTVITVNLENEAVRRYMSEVTYTSLEDTSKVNDFNVAPPRRRDLPNGAVVPIPAGANGAVTLVYADSADYVTGAHTIAVENGAKEVTVYNLIPQRKYYYKIEDETNVLTRGEIHTEGQVRMIYVPSTNNVRDLGGWRTTDGRMVKYGKLFRGAELNGQHDADSTDIAVFTDLLGVGGEIDMRNSRNPGAGTSVFGFKVSTYGNLDEPTYYCTWDSGMIPQNLPVYNWRYRWRREFEFIVNNFQHGRNVFFHCTWGGDRTGYLALLLEGLLGVEYDGMIKDYELTSFYAPGRVKEKIDSVIIYIQDIEGETLRDKFNKFFVDSLKTTQDKIDYFRTVMLTDTIASIDDSGEGDDENPITAIRHYAKAARKATLYGISGQQVGRTGRKGLVIEIDSDGKVRKIVR